MSSERIPVTLVSGLHGSGKTELIHNIVKSLQGSDLKWVLDHASQSLLHLINYLGIQYSSQPRNKTILNPSPCRVGVIESICCDVDDRLIQRVDGMSTSGQYTHLLIELEPAAKPIQVAEIFEKRDVGSEDQGAAGGQEGEVEGDGALAGVARVAACITVLEASRAMATM